MWIIILNDADRKRLDFLMLQSLPFFSSRYEISDVLLPSVILKPKGLQ